MEGAMSEKRRDLTRSITLTTLLCLLLTACSGTDSPSSNRTSYSLDANASGVIEKVNNIVNMTVVSKDANDLKAEYRAGFVQGKLQGRQIISARDNNWDDAYLVDPGHTFPKQPGPTRAELDQAGGLLNDNYNAFIAYLRSPTTDTTTAHLLKRLLFRMLGIYHGVSQAQPAALDFSGTWLPDSSYFKATELVLGYETPGLTFLDLYYVNANFDMMDVIANSPELSVNGISTVEQNDKCSAFLKRSGNEIYLTHNSWMGFLSQSMTQTINVNGDMTTMNAATPGLIGSDTDFGYNNKGVMFNETTHRSSRSVTKTDGIWLFWRSALAEQFSSSVDDFFKYISIDNSGTYLNGYMVADVKNNETGLVEMSYRCFIYYKSTGGPYTVTAKSLDGGACSTAYDPELVTPDYLMGINYPASYQVAQDLRSTDNRPARRVQFKQLLPGVDSIEKAKSVITYTDPANPLSIFGRWDLGYGQTSYPKLIPDGAVDAKAASGSMVRSFMGLSGALDLSAGSSGFWMLYGTPHVNGAPFVWSQSAWKWQKLRDVPDRIDGTFTLMSLYLR
jgi:hypothetical protein